MIQAIQRDTRRLRQHLRPGNRTQRIHIGSNRNRTPILRQTGPRNHRTKIVGTGRKIQRARTRCQSETAGTYDILTTSRHLFRIRVISGYCQRFAVFQRFAFRCAGHHLHFRQAERHWIEHLPVRHDCILPTGCQQQKNDPYIVTLFHTYTCFPKLIISGPVLSYPYPHRTIPRVLLSAG